MVDNVKIPWSTRLGRIGEKEIEKRLAYFSNPTKYETDVGIDFYCELLVNDKPSVPFYVQAKSTEYFDDKWGVSIEKSTVIYWLQQKSPVYLIVFDEKNNYCYWLSIEDQRYEYIKRIFTTDSKTIYITIDDTKLLSAGRNNGVFRAKIIADQVSLDLFLGLPQFIGNGYVKGLPPIPRSEIELKRIIERIRMNMYSLIQYFFNIGDIQSAYTYCSFLTKIDKSHFNHFYWFAHANKLLGNVSNSRNYYKEAIKICQRDNKWPKSQIEKIIKDIEIEMNSLDSD